MIRKLVIATAAALCGTAFAQLPTVHSMGELERQGFITFDALSAPLVFEARGNRPLKADVVLSGQVYDLLPADLRPIMSGYAGKDEFGRHDTVERMTPYLGMMREQAANSRGIVLKLANRANVGLREYNFDTHEQPFEIITSISPSREFPGGLFCDGSVDRNKYGTTRSFCIFPTNWTPKGEWSIPDASFAQTFKQSIKNGEWYLYLVAEYDGAARVDDKGFSSAGSQGIKVLGYYLVSKEPNRQVLMSIPFEDKGPLIQTTARPIAATADSSVNNVKASSRARPAVNKPIALREIPLQTKTKATTKDSQPVLIDLH